MRRTRLAAILAAGLGLVALPPDARACCPAPPRGVHVQIADQEVLIVWNAATRTEHFIRRAAFDTKLASFGFLVPTPSMPALAEARRRSSTAARSRATSRARP